jgi:hypothetical protein
MAKSTPAAPVAAEAEPVRAEPVAPAAPAAPILTLDDACALMSARGGKHAPAGKYLLAAFYHTEEAAGRTSGTEAEFRERLAAFASAPAA